MDNYLDGVFLFLGVVGLLSSIVSLGCTIYCLRFGKMERRERAFGIKLVIIGLIAMLLFVIGFFAIPDPHKWIVIAGFLALFLWGVKYRDKSLKHIREEVSDE